MTSAIIFIFIIALIRLRDTCVGYTKHHNTGEKKNIFEYINSDHHWHTFGHYFFFFFLEAFLVRYGWYSLLGLFALSLILEAVQGFKYKHGDFWFDLITYNARS